MKKACTCSAKTGAATPEEENACFCAFPSLSGGWPRQLERTADHFRNAMGMPNIQGVIVFAPGGCMALALKKFETSLGLPCRPLRFDGRPRPARLRIWKRRWPDPPTKACCKPSA